MNDQPSFYLDTDLGKGLKALFDALQHRLQLKAPIKVYIAGGIAVHLYTAYRVSMDVDAEFGARLHLPADLGVEVMGPNGRPLWLHFDAQYNSTFALMHEDYQDDAQRVPLAVEYFDVHVLSPVDLAVSKISRFAKHDQEDIAALVLHGLTTADAIERRALDALPGFVGNVGPLKMNTAMQWPLRAEQRVVALTAHKASCRRRSATRGPARLEEVASLPVRHTARDPK